MADPHTTDTPQPDTEVAPGIVTNPARRSGRPTIKGTRITVDDVLYRLAAGDTADRVQYNYSLTSEQLRDALRYAADLVRSLVPELTDADLDRMAAEAQQRQHMSEVGD